MVTVICAESHVKDFILFFATYFPRVFKIYSLSGQLQYIIKSVGVEVGKAIALGREIELLPHSVRHPLNFLAYQRSKQILRTYQEIVQTLSLVIVARHATVRSKRIILS